jgi:tetratricopeptide (TPR) repeat protein
VVLAILVNSVFFIFFFSSCTVHKSIPEEHKASTFVELDYALNEANRLYLFGSYSQSYDIYKSCIKFNDSCALAYYQLANIEGMKKNLESALAYSKLANRFDDSNIWYKNQLIELLKYTGNFDTLSVIYPKLIHDFPDKPEYRFDYAVVLLDKNKNREALAQLDSVQEITGAAGNVLYLKSKIYLYLNNYVDAENTIQQAVKSDPTNYQYLLQLSSVYQKSGRLQLADSVFRINCKENYEDNPVYVDYIHFLKNTKYKIPADFIEETLSDTLSENIKKSFIVSVLSDSSIYRDTNLLIPVNNFLAKSKTFQDRNLFIADIAMKSGRYEEAIPFVEDYISRNEVKQEVYDQLLSLYNATGNYQKMYDLSTKLSLSNTSDNIVFYKALSSLQLNKCNETINAIQGTKYDNKKIRLVYLELLSEAYFKLNNKDSAFWACEQILKYDSKNYSTKNNYAYYLSVYDESLPKAENLIIDVLKQFPDNSTYLDTYAWILYKMRKYTKAKAYIEKALSKGDGKNSEILDHAGDIYYMLNDYKSARMYWNASYLLSKNPETLKKITNEK